MQQTASHIVGVWTNCADKNWLCCYVLALPHTFIFGLLGVLFSTRSVVFFVL